MFKLCANIRIISDKTWSFDTITSCEIERDIKNITAKCTLTLPKKTKWRNETKIPVKRGDRISVKLGYDDALTEVFSGYIVRITTKTPVEIYCEDEIYVLKNTAAKKKTYANADLVTVLGEQLPKGMQYEVFSTQKFGKYVVNTDTVAALLDNLSENGFSFYFREGTLYGGVMFDHSEQVTGKKQTFKEAGIDGDTGNIIDDDDLVWNTAESISLRIQAKGTDANGKKISAEVGDPDGELRTFFKYNTTTEALTAEAKQKLEEWKVTGFSGSFTTFGARPVWLLDLIKIKTKEYPTGATYRVTKTVISYGEGGYRQQITINN